jgi:DNA-binding transcriptional LysR family regulator
MARLCSDHKRSRSRRNACWPFSSSAANARWVGPYQARQNSITPGAYLVPELLRQFQELNPEARPVLRVGDSAEALEWLLDYRAPLGVIGEMSIAESLQSVEIGSDRLQLVAAAGDALCRVKR